MSYNVKIEPQALADIQVLAVISTCRNPKVWTEMIE